jgi:hypothetical protein
MLEFEPSEIRSNSMLKRLKTINEFLGFPRVITLKVLSNAIAPLFHIPVLKKHAKQKSRQARLSESKFYCY